MIAFRHLLVSAYMAAVMISPTTAQVVTDGSLGPVLNLDGPNMTIGADLGTRAGNNLFHSFETFNINTGQSATFTGPGNLDNVVSRVTGGAASTIDGRLTSEIPGADFWLVNPAGVVFGENAEVDVPAGFHVGGAESIEFSDGSSFSATAPQPVLSVASPESFGFLSGDVVLDGTQLGFDTSSATTFAGQDVVVQGGAVIESDGDGSQSLTLEGGNVTISDSTLRTGSKGEPGTIAITSDKDVLLVSTNYDPTPLWIYDPDYFNVVEINSNSSASGGNLSISAGRQFAMIGAEIVAIRDGQIPNFSSDEGGAISISAKHISIEDSVIAATTSGEGRSISISISADNNTSIHNDVQIRSTTDGQGNSSDISIISGNILKIFDDVGILTESSSLLFGGGGDIHLKANKVLIRDGDNLSTVFISTASYGSGNSGMVAIEAFDDVIIEGDVWIRTDYAGAAAVLGISSTVPGSAGSILIS